MSGDYKISNLKPSNMGTPLGVISLILSLTSFAVPIKPFFTGTTGAILAWVILIMIFLSMLAISYTALYQTAIAEREQTKKIIEGIARNRENAELLHRVMKEINDVSCKIQRLHLDLVNHSDDKRDAASAALLHRYLRQIARSFQQLTNADSEVRVCIKRVAVRPKEGGSHERIVETLARSNTSDIDQSRYDPIIKNTDFQQISSGNHNHWHSNNINKEKGYSNTSPTRDYKSVLIWGVRKFDPKKEENAIIAFLCIDSSTENLFDVERDLKFGWPIVDAIRVFLKAQMLS